MKLKNHYDKLLHVLGAFTVLIWLNKVFLPVGALIILFLLCVGKTALNYMSDKTYKPFGDWIANIIGFGLWLIYYRV